MFFQEKPNSEIQANDVFIAVAIFHRLHPANHKEQEMFILNTIGSLQAQSHCQQHPYSIWLYINKLK